MILDRSVAFLCGVSVRNVVAKASEPGSNLCSAAKGERRLGWLLFPGCVDNMQIYQTEKSYTRFRDIDMDWDIGSPSSQNSWMQRVASQVSQYLPQTTMWIPEKGRGGRGTFDVNEPHSDSKLLVKADGRQKDNSFIRSLYENDRGFM